MHYTFNHDLNLAYAESDPAVKGPSIAISEFMPRLVGVLDPEALMRLSSLDPSGQSGFVIRALRAFECSSQRWRRLLQVALSEDDTVGVSEVVHTFKSAAAMVGALKLSRMCAEAERLAQGRRTRDLDQLVDDILSESARILAILGPLRRV